MSNSQLASEIISIIRANVLAGIYNSGVSEHDDWNEGKCGAEWCNNEIGLFRDLYELAYPRRNHRLNRLEECESVAQIHVLLARCDQPILIALFSFCRNGGTSNQQYFELRDADQPDIDTIRLSFVETNLP